VHGNGALAGPGTGTGAGILALLTAATAAGAVLLAGCAAGPGRPRPPVTAGASARPESPGTGSARPTATPSRPARLARPGGLPVAPGAGRRPQTRASPSAHSPAFRAAMTDLWAAVRSGKPGPARPAFFPLPAYLRVKAIPDPAADWHNRLYAAFGLDVAAAHRLLGANARKATLVRVIVPAAQAAWIEPGACYNSVGYWHVAGAGGLPGRRAYPVVRDRLADLLARRVVRGPPGRGGACRSRRRG
jgi:hypothetical protein